MGFIIDAISWFFSNLFWSVKVILTPIAYLAGQLLGLLLDGLLTVVLGLLSALDLGTLVTHASTVWGVLDPNVAWMINATGISEGLTIIGAAFLILFTLNLIPAEFTRV